MAKAELEPTHTAYTLSQTARNTNQWVELGTARLEDNGAMHVKLIVMPISGFRGYLYLAPAGQKPPTIEPILRRPGTSDGEPAEVGM